MLARTQLTLARQEGEREPRLRDLEEAKRQIQQLESELRDAHRLVAEMQATNVWRFGTSALARSGHTALPPPFRLTFPTLRERRRLRAPNSHAGTVPARGDGDRNGN